ncbi:unnamed protein product [Arctogadus glacialis]
MYCAVKVHGLRRRSRRSLRWRSAGGVKTNQLLVQERSRWKSRWLCSCHGGETQSMMTEQLIYNDGLLPIHPEDPWLHLQSNLPQT